MLLPLVPDYHLSRKTRDACLGLLTQAAKSYGSGVYSRLGITMPAAAAAGRDLDRLFSVVVRTRSAAFPATMAAGLVQKNLLRWEREFQTEFEEKITGAIRELTAQDGPPPLRLRDEGFVRG